jgi:hypothetical protein
VSIPKDQFDENVKASLQYLNECKQCQKRITDLLKEEKFQQNRTAIYKIFAATFPKPKSRKTQYPAPKDIANIDIVFPFFKEIIDIHAIWVKTAAEWMHTYNVPQTETAKQNDIAKIMELKKRTEQRDLNANNQKGILEALKENLFNKKNYNKRNETFNKHKESTNDENRAALKKIEKVMRIIFPSHGRNDEDDKADESYVTDPTSPRSLWESKYESLDDDNTMQKIAELSIESWQDITEEMVQTIKGYFDEDEKNDINKMDEEKIKYYLMEARLRANSMSSAGVGATIGSFLSL